MLRRAVRAAIAVAGLLAAAPALALDPTKGIDQLTQEVWQVEHGLPQDSISGISQASDGYLWLSTLGGVVRFDGMAFARIDRSSLPDLRDDRLASLSPARAGGIWVAAMHGVIRWSDGGPATLGRARSLSTRDVRAVHEDDEGTLWIGTNDGLFRLVGDDRVERHGEVLQGKEVTKILRDRSGRIWLATAQGPWMLEGTRPAISPVDLPRMPRAIAEDRAGRIWIATGSGLWAFHDGRFTNVSVADGLPSPAVYAVLEDRDANLWVGTDKGLARMQGGQVSSYGAREGLPDEQVRSLFEDREGSLWVGTNGGLARFTDRTLPVVAAGPSAPSINTVCEDDTGAVWIGTQGFGLLRWKDGALTTYTMKDGLSSPMVQSIVPGAGEEVFVGTMGGLDRGRDGRFAPVQVDGQPFTRPVRALERTARGAIWAAGAAPSILVRIEGEKTTVLGPEQGLPGWTHRLIHEDRRGQVWLGSNEGLVRWDGRAFAVIGPEQGLTGGRVQAMVEDREGTLWVGTGLGEVARIRDGKIESFGARQGLPESEILQVLEDDGGDLWLSTYGGLLRVRKSAFDDLIAGKIPLLPNANYRMSDRRRSVVFNGRTQPAGWKGRDGRLWFPTRGMGVVSVDPRRLRLNRSPPSSVIQRMVVDQQEVPLIGAPRIAPGARWFEFQFAGIGLLEPHRVRHQVRLVGLEDRWRDLGSRRVVSYQDIPPGRYAFEVRSANNDGLWGEANASFSFQLLPRFTQTAWFYLLCALPIALALGGLYRLRVVRLRAVYDAVLAERTRVARELHDRLLQGITAVTWQLENVAAKSAVSPEATKRQLDVARAMLAESVAEARRVVWDLRPEVGGRSELGDALSTSLERLGQGAPAAIDFGIEGVPFPLSPSVQSHLFNMAREAVTNALKHAGARRIEVRLAYRAEEVRLRVADDGRGFDGEAPEGHFGLVGLRERAAELRGTLDIESRPGAGTQVEIRVPVPERRDA